MNSHLIITKPLNDEYPEWFAGEIESVHYNDLIAGLTDSFSNTLLFLQGLDDDDVAYRYAPGKWSIKQMWQHINDVERILCYRALRNARQDATVLYYKGTSGSSTLSVRAICYLILGHEIHHLQTINSRYINRKKN